MIEAEAPAMIEVTIDPDLRVGVNQQLTFAGYKDIEGDEVPEVGESVVVVSRADGSVSTGIVVAVNEVAMLVYLAVAWAEFETVEEVFG